MGASKGRKATPVRAALVDNSHLLNLIQEGLGALKSSDKALIAAELRSAFLDSIDIDTGLRAGHDQENRWDYLLGHGAREVVVALEPHAARQGEIRTIIRKRRAALEQLRPHLRAGSKITAWFWVATGSVRFADTEKARRILDQNGITFVDRCLKRAHLR